MMNHDSREQPEWGYIKAPTPQPQQYPPSDNQWSQAPPPGDYPQAPQPPYTQAPQQYGQNAGYPEYSPYSYPVQHSLPKGMSIWSLVLGIISLLFVPFLTGTVAVILGGIAIGRCNRGEASGKGMAVAGLVMGIIGIVGWVILLVAVGSQMTDFDMTST